MFHVAVKTHSVFACVPLNTVGSVDKGNITIIVIGKFIITDLYLSLQVILIVTILSYLNGIITKF